jgi:beta-lactamase class A
MAKTMQDVHDGRLSLEDKLTIRKQDVVGGAGVTTWYNAGEKRTIAQLIQLMVVESDNTATNMLIDKLGMANINQYLQQYGYKDTLLVHKLMVNKKASNKNLSSVRDIGHLLTNLYYYQLVGEKEDAFMLDILKQQRDKECFPAVVSGYDIAHKTGELGGLYDDGGIIYHSNRDMIFVIMTEHYSSRYRAIETMKSMAQIAFAY